jgi:hypothetical protein
MVDPCPGPVCPRQPTKGETVRPGRIIGGWKHNALRDSSYSYRAHITQNIHRVGYEIGNSPAMVKLCYHRRQPIGVAKKWFSFRPDPAGIIRFPAQKKSSKKFRPGNTQTIQNGIKIGRFSYERDFAQDAHAGSSPAPSTKSRDQLVRSLASCSIWLLSLSDSVLFPRESRAIAARNALPPKFQRSIRNHRIACSRFARSGI